MRHERLEGVGMDKMEKRLALRLCRWDGVSDSEGLECPGIVEKMFLRVGVELLPVTNGFEKKLELIRSIGAERDACRGDPSIEHGSKIRRDRHRRG